MSLPFQVPAYWRIDFFCLVFVILRTTSENDSFGLLRSFRVWYAFLDRETTLVIINHMHMHIYMHINFTQQNRTKTPFPA